MKKVEIKMKHWTKALLALLSFTGVSLTAQAASLTDIKFASLPGDVTEMQLIFDEVPPQPKSYTIDQPARIAMDFSGVASELASKYHKIGFGNARSATVVGAGNRTRLIVNLNELVPYSSTIEGNKLVVLLGQEGAKASQTASVARQQSSKKSSDLAEIVDIDFRRGDQGEGQVLITLTDPTTPVDMQQSGGKIRVEFPRSKLPENLQRRLDVIDFATPVRFVDAVTENGYAVINIEPTGDYEYLAYQTNNQLALNVKPITTEEQAKRLKDKFPYTGQKMTLDFQDVQVRTVLQIIAETVGFNLVASDAVGGSITLRLENVPWDQALDLVLKTQGLAKRQNGNVLMVAPADEIAAREKQELEANRQVKELAPLRTEYLQVKYAKATDLLTLIKEGKGLLSPRGSAAVDERTNILLIQDTESNLEDIRQAIDQLDIPVRQVMIEARIVIARTSVGEDLGIRWGGAQFSSKDSSRTSAGGAVIPNRTGTAIGGSINSLNQSRTIMNETLANEISIDAGDEAGDLTAFDSNDANMINFPVLAGEASTFAIGINALDTLLDLELSALEQDGKAEIISQPRIITSDGKAAKIEAGTEIPYQEASASGATSVSFKAAVLKLEVTPQITPDDRIIMDLVINQDSVGELTLAGPSIDTNEVETQVLVENGETVVLGGIYKTEEITQVSKTPFLGDLPVIGALFRRTEYSDLKSELLVFITPRLVKDSLSSSK